MTARDAEILRVELSEQIESLRPLTSLPGWRAAFETAVATWRAKGNGQPATSEYARECYGWAAAHQIILDESAQ